MLELEQLGTILDEYVELVVPAMLQNQYQLWLVKGGPDYPHLAEQSHFSHIINGVFGLSALMRFLITRNVHVPGLDATMLRKALALYTIHEVHKARDSKLLGASQFSIPIERLREEWARLALSRFAQADEHLMRAANVHKRSPKHGDLLASADQTAARLWLLVRLADTLASVVTPEEGVSSLRAYLSHLAPAFAPKAPPGQFALYYHEMKDVRGILTNTIHQAVAAYLERECDFYPLLFFPTGTLYLGPIATTALSREALARDVASAVLQGLVERGSASSDAIRSAVRGTYYDFETFVYSFATVPDLLQVVRDDCLAIATSNVKAIEGDLSALLAKRDLPDGWDEASVRERLGIAPEEPRVFAEHWLRARRYLLYLDKILRALNRQDNTLEWFLAHLDVPADVATALREVGELWAKGGPGKYVLVAAYHFLRGPSFADRSAEALPPEEVIERLHRRVLAALTSVDTQAGRQAAVAELGLREDLEAYLHQELQLSFAPGVELSDDPLESYTARKGKGHTRRICSLCNRSSKYVDELRAGILDDFGRVFSNRVLPAHAAPQGNRLWCPVCQLEFILRKVNGMGLPARAHYKNSRRMYLYVLPTFSFTREHLRLFGPLLRSFHQPTNVPVRDYGEDEGLPHRWIERRAFDPEWEERVQEILEREGGKIGNWGGSAFVGERLSLAPTPAQPHYYLITWEKLAGDGEPDDARIATSTEAWAKALFTAGIISGLTSCRVYVTERPHLPVADPAHLPATITLDAPHPAISCLLRQRTDTVSLYGKEKGARSELERMLDLTAATWIVTADVHRAQRNTKDKHVAGRLRELRASPLAGATFYKQFARLNDGQSPYSALATACSTLLEVQAETEGGELMELVEELASKSLEIALPRGGSGRGKARRYELLFREAVSAMRRAQRALPEMRTVAVSGRPSAETIDELKQMAAGTLLKGLERRRTNRRGEVVICAPHKEMGRLVGEFIDLLVDRVYLDRAAGSFARFLRLENALADGIFYYTDRNLSDLWRSYHEQRARYAQAQANDQGGAA